MRTVTVRLRWAMRRVAVQLSPHATLRFLLTLGGVLIAGWLLGGAGPAHADTAPAYADSAVPEPAAPVSAVLSAVTDTTAGVTAVPADDATSLPLHRVGLSLDRVVSSSVPAELLTVADTMDAVSDRVPAPRLTRCGRICDLVRDGLVRDLDRTPLFPPGFGSEPPSPWRIADLSPADALKAPWIPLTPSAPSAPPDQSGAAGTSPVAGGFSPISHRLGSTSGRDERSDSAGHRRETSIDDLRRARARTCVRCSHAAPSTSPVTSDVSAPGGTMPSLNSGQAQARTGVAYLSGSSLRRPGTPVGSPATTTASPSFPSSVGKPSFSPD